MYCRYLVNTNAWFDCFYQSHCALEPPGVVDFYRALGENATIENLEMVRSVWHTTRCMVYMPLGTS